MRGRHGGTGALVQLSPAYTLRSFSQKVKSTASLLSVQTGDIPVLNFSKLVKYTVD